MQDFITQLESELEKSLKQRDAAKKDRERAELEEAKWEQDVRALKNLISRRRNDPVHGGSIDTIQAAADYSTVDDPDYVSSYEEINRVEWSFEQIAKAGTAGMLPTEIYEAAGKQHLSMHKNYPYVATSKLLERGRIEKIGKRYRVKQKEVPSEESTS